MAVELVGREAEQSSLLAFLDRAHAGARALVLEGEAGIGKTTLWLAAVEAARQRGFRVLVARPAEAERELGFAALGDVLADVLEDALPRLSAPRRRALEAALLLGGEDEEPADPRAVALAVGDTIYGLAEDAPVLVASDDVQWLDAPSAVALAFALRRVDARPVAVLLARRSGTPRSALEEAVEPVAERIRVGPMSLGAVQGILKARIGRAFPRPVLRRLHEASGGNPFFALELARALERRAAPVDPATPLPVPETLERLVGDRIRALPEDTHGALLAVAALGSPTARLLAELDVRPQELDPALAAGVLVRADREIRFSHPLLATEVYAAAPAAERRRMHSRIAEVLSEPVAHARHLALALEAPDEAVASRLEAAAGIARTRGAASVAAELGEAAARATPADRADDRRRRLARAARDHLAGGLPDAAFALARSLLADAAPGRPRAEALVLLGDLENLVGDIGEAVEHHRRALREPGLPAVLEAVIHEQLAHDLRIFEGLGAAEEHARRSVALAEEAGDEALVARALAALATVQFNRGEPDSFDLAERSLALARASGDRTAVAEAATAHGHCLLWSGRIDQARQVFEELRALAEERDEPVVASALWYLSLVEHQAGELALARRLIEASRELALQYERPELADEPATLMPLARTALFQGEHELARALVQRALAYAGPQLGLSTVRANLALLAMLDHWSGDSARAVERFEEVDRERRAAGFSHSTSLWVAEQVEALLGLGRIADADAILDEWDTESRRLPHVWAVPEIVRSRGLVAAARGDVATALELLEDAAGRHEEVGDPFGRGRALLALGTMRRRARQKRPAREAIEEARATFERIGAAFWAERARAELGRIGGRTKVDGLTPAEQRVAALVAEGKTNREVAAALFLGERTVETHLSHVYAKLGIRSRAELARMLR
ncbi:MAG TPA: AAA family ATPase [Gaiellaceae bacterium]|nr:AAA family ATPase [Gaiellaceae bacterium]